MKIDSIQRHRILTLEWQPLSPDHGYNVSGAIEEAVVVEVEDTGGPINVPVGDASLGRVMNLLGEPIDERIPVVPSLRTQSTPIVFPLPAGDSPPEPMYVFYAPAHQREHIRALYDGVRVLRQVDRDGVIDLGRRIQA